MRSVVLFAVIVTAAVSAAQSPPSLPPSPSPPRAELPQVAPSRPPQPAHAEPAPDKSLDQLLDRLEALRAQKAELERQEQDVVKEIQRKLERQSDRLQRLGVGGNGPVVPVAPSVSFAPAPLIPSPYVPTAPGPATIPAPAPR